MPESYVVGVDFGGTNLKAGVCDDNGNLLSFSMGPTFSKRPIHVVIENICEVIFEAIKESGIDIKFIQGVCIGACGLIDRKNGIFVSSSVLPKWNNVKLSESISKKINIPVFLENDANACIFGEWAVGVAHGLKNVVGMTLGTGIGGAAILNSELYYGSNENAGEFGHMTVDPYGPKCYCGNRGCLGLLASGDGLLKRFTKGITKIINDNNAKQWNSNIDTPEKIFLAAENGDDYALECIVETGKMLGIGVSNLLSSFNPEMVVFTGGLTKMGTRLLNVIREEAFSRVYPKIKENSSIYFGSLGDRAGVIGSALIIMNHERIKNGKYKY